MVKRRSQILTQVAQQVQSFGIDNIHVHRLSDAPKTEDDTGIQELARQARYSVFSDVASRHETQHIVTAHHADDQV